MMLHGPVSSNLEAALASARRLRNQRVHPETLSFWYRLLDHASVSSSDMRPANRAKVGALISELESELAARPEVTGSSPHGSSASNRAGEVPERA